MAGGMNEYAGHAMAIGPSHKSQSCEMEEGGPVSLCRISAFKKCKWLTSFYPSSPLSPYFSPPFNLRHVEQNRGHLAFSCLSTKREGGIRHPFYREKAGTLAVYMSLFRR